MLEKLTHVWQSYKYRFVPWLAFNLMERTVRSVEVESRDKIITDDLVIAQLTSLITALHGAALGLCVGEAASHQKALKVMEEVMGFHVTRAPSAVGGTGVVVKGRRHHQTSDGTAVIKGQLVGLYPGAMYLPIQPIFFQSIGNPFVFRCADGVLIDGHDKRMSKSLFKSCVNRDRVGPFVIADMSWLTPYPLNPLSIGQYVNNQNKDHPSNVAYQEVTLDGRNITLQERRFFPNLWYSPPEGIPVSDVPVRLVALVATRDICSGEELFSDYFTIIR